MNSSDNNNTKHVRTYKACSSCRRRKVKCDLGSVDNPHPPPCARCRRANKECYFEQEPDEPQVAQEASNNTDARAGSRSAKRRRTDNGPANRPSVSTSIRSSPRLRVDSNTDNAEDTGQDANSVSGGEDPDVHMSALTLARTFTVLYQGSVSQSQKTDNVMPHVVDVAGTQDQTAAYETVLKAWKQVVFVQDGLFTASEALGYMNFFRDKLAPFTPVYHAQFLESLTHSVLLHQEPVLVTAILTIASRHCLLPGPGAVSRRFTIHERLWSTLQEMLNRIQWAQDDFPTSKRPNYLRSLGTCEALLLLSEWHHRALHFPDGRSALSIVVSGPQTPRTNEYQGQSPRAWMEWSWRSDRLSWSLLWTAYSLATDLGVFSEDEDIFTHAFQSQEEQDRARRLQQLLKMFLAQTSSRLRKRASISERLMAGNTSILSDVGRLWTQLTKIALHVEGEMFSSPQQSRDIIRNGLYIGLVQTTRVTISKWQQDFETASVPDLMRLSLSVEVAGLRTQLYGIALQAIHMSGQPVSYDQCNRDFITEMLAAARSVLRIVIDDLYPRGRLPHLPNRFYLRILSAVMHLLKAIQAADTADEVETSCQLIEATGHALQESVSDDATLTTRWGTLIITLTQKERQMFYQRTTGQTAHTAPQNVEAGQDPFAVPAPAAAAESLDDFLSFCDPSTWVSFPFQMEAESRSRLPGQDFTLY